MDPSMNIQLSHSSSSSINSYQARPPSPDSPIAINIKDDTPDTLVQQDPSEFGYSEHDFMNKINNDLHQVRQDMNKHSISSQDDILDSNMDIDDILHLRSDSNSPVMSILDSQYGSRTNSDIDDDENDDDNDDAGDSHNNVPYQGSSIDSLSSPPNHTQQRLKKFRFKDIEKTINKYHSVDIDVNFSSEIDILTTYIKGQKSLFIYSKLATQRKLACLTLPALFISAVLTITSPYLSCNPWNLEITSGLNACVTFLLSVISFLKLESTVEAYFQMATHLDTIQTSLELANSKFVLLNKDHDTKQLTIDKFNEVEEKINEFKTNNKLLIPEEVKILFPVISHIDFFSFIKRNKLYRKKLLEKLLYIKNEIEYIHYKWDKHQYQQHHYPQYVYDNSFNARKNNKEMGRLKYLYEEKKQLHEEIIDVQNIYGILDDIFAREIKHAETKKHSFFLCIPLSLFYKHSPTETYLDNLEPHIAKHFSFLYKD